MGRVLSRRRHGDGGGWAIWLIPLLIGLPASLVLSVLTLPAPNAGRVTGVFAPAGEGLSAFLALLQVEPDLRLVDERWNGRLIFVISEREDFPRLARRNGALIMFDAQSVGCRFSPDRSAPAKLAASKAGGP